MSNHDASFAESSPITWSFHRNTSRWTWNALAAVGDAVPKPPREYPDLPWTPLPPPALPVTPLADAIAARFSCRRYDVDRAISLADLSTLLQAAYGILDRTQLGSLEFLERAVPSGGGLYPLELHIMARAVDALAPGIYHYAVIGHGLEQRRDIDLPVALREYLFMGQGRLTAVPIIIVITAALPRSLGKYGDRGYRYVLFEAGHVAQNINLTASALGLGSCNIGGFFDQELGDVLRLDRDDEVCLYAVAIGHPASGDRQHLRAIDAAD